MTKKVKKSKKTPPPDIRSFPIQKHKSFISNLNNFIKMLHHQKLTSRQFILEVHSFVKRHQEKHKKKDPTIEAARLKIRICKHCDGWSGKASMLQCVCCEDYYHEHCLAKAKEAFQKSGMCPECDREKTDKFDKEAYLSEFIEDRCYNCGVERQGREAFVHCMRCTQQFHKSCYGKNVAVCTDCKAEIDGKFYTYLE
jgi:hypothetical protein